MTWRPRRSHSPSSASTWRRVMPQLGSSGEAAMKSAALVQAEMVCSSQRSCWLLTYVMWAS